MLLRQTVVELGTGSGSGAHCEETGWLELQELGKENVWTHMIILKELFQNLHQPAWCLLLDFQSFGQLTCRNSNCIHIRLKFSLNSWQSLGRVTVLHHYTTVIIWWPTGNFLVWMAVWLFWQSRLWSRVQQRLKMKHNSLQNDVTKVFQENV